MLKLKCSCITWRRATKEKSHENVSKYYLYNTIVIVLACRQKNGKFNSIIFS